MDFIYIDCFSGISGDMFLAALLEIGFPFERLEEYLAPMGLNVFINAPETSVQGIKARRFEVQDRAPRYRNLTDIQRLLDLSLLPPKVADQASNVMQSIASAEASIHNLPIESIHFHEIGAADTIIDVIGVLAGLHFLEINNIYCSPLPWSNGFVSIAHGCYPCPAPATALLLQGVPCRGVSADMELVTPTGAALISFLRPTFGPFPIGVPDRVGYGAGTKTRQDSVPNLLRLVAGTLGLPSPPNHELVALLETEIDDMNPEHISFLFELLLQEPQVLDVFTAPVHMKKNRTGLLLSVLSRPESVSHIASIILSHSTSLGLRYSLQSRLVASREERRISTPFGLVRVKYATLPDGSRRFKPEYDDCRGIALQNGLSLAQVYKVINNLAEQYLFPDSD